MTTQLPSKEKIQWLHDACEEAAAVGIKLTMNPNELLMFTRALLSAYEQEPVAVVDVQSGRPDNHKFAWCLTRAAHALPDGVYNLHTQPAPSTAEFAGWQAKKHGGDWVTIKPEDVNHYRFNEEVPVRMVFTAPQTVVPAGWEPCSPEWIERNGPCSCGEAPRIAFGTIGNHYHPHMYHNPAPSIRAVPEEVMRCLGFFASVIKSGESWTSVCQHEYDTAKEACRAAMLNGGKS